MGMMFEAETIREMFVLPFTNLKEQRDPPVENYRSEDKWKKSSTDHRLNATLYNCLDASFETEMEK